MLKEPTKFYTIHVNKKHALKVAFFLGLSLSLFTCYSFELLQDPFQLNLLRGISEFLIVFHFPFTIYFLYRKLTPVLSFNDQYFSSGTRSYWFMSDIEQAHIENTFFRQILVMKNKNKDVWKFSFDEKICEDLPAAKLAILDIIPPENPVYRLIENL